MSGGRITLSRIVSVFAWTGLTSVGGGRYAFFYTLARSGIHDSPTAVIAGAAALVLWTRRVPAMIVVLAAGAVGWLTGL